MLLLLLALSRLQSWTLYCRCGVGQPLQRRRGSARQLSVPAAVPQQQAPRGGVLRQAPEDGGVRARLVQRQQRLLLRLWRLLSWQCTGRQAHVFEVVQQCPYQLPGQRYIRGCQELCCCSYDLLGADGRPEG
jgi:hypothetical protein